MNIQDLYNELAQLISAQQKINTPLIVGINGIDGSGKTSMASGLADYLRSKGKSICTVSIDDFHHPKAVRYRNGETSPQAYYQDSINYDGFAARALKPIYQAKNTPIKAITKIHDLDSDREICEYATIDKNTIILVEGVFLFRPEIAKYLHFKIFVDVDPNITLERMKIRDVKNPSSQDSIDEYEQRCLTKYRPGQKLYFADVDVRGISDVIINNNNYKNPYILKKP